jgi:hypothetical protein
MFSKPDAAFLAFSLLSKQHQLLHVDTCSRTRIRVHKIAELKCHNIYALDATRIR